MLRTLLAEEVRSLAAEHLRTLGVLAVLTAALLALVLLDLPVASSLALGGAVALSVLAAPIVLVHTAYVYWQTMHGERGYLTMTVPARGRAVLGAKVLYAIGAGLVAAAFTALGLLLTAVAEAHARGVALGELLDPVRRVLDMIGGGHVAGGVVYLVVELVSLIVCVAAVMSIGAQARWNHLGFAAPVIGLVALYLVLEALSLVALLVIPVSVDLTTGDVVARSMLPQFLEMMRGGSDPTLLGLGFLGVWPLLAVVLGVWGVRAVEHGTSLR